MLRREIKFIKFLSIRDDHSLLLRDPYLYLDMEGEKEEGEKQVSSESYWTISRTLLAMMRKSEVHSA